MNSGEAEQCPDYAGAKLAESKLLKPRFHISQSPGQGPVIITQEARQAIGDGPAQDSAEPR